MWKTFNAFVGKSKNAFFSLKIRSDYYIIYTLNSRVLRYDYDTIRDNKTMGEDSQKS